MVFFFFSSRRRHTRLTCDWSSDVCSSDLNAPEGKAPFGPANRQGKRGYATSSFIKEALDRGAEKFSWSERVARSEEHTSELQSHVNLVCRLLLEKKKKTP